MREQATAEFVAAVDHVTTVLADRAARRVFSALSRMGMFVVWPYTHYGAFASGGVRVGNLNVEVIGVPGGAQAAAPPVAGAEPAGRGPGPDGAGTQPDGAAAGAQAGGPAGPGEAAGAGEPAPAGWPRQFLTLAPAALGDLPGELSRRGVGHGEPAPFVPEPGGEPLFTTVDLPGLGSGELAVQFCGYPDGPHTQTVPSRDLAGVQQADRVVIGASELERARERWAALLSPAGAAPGTAWQPGYGPALELRAAGNDAVAEVAVRVRSRPVARAAFTAAGLDVSGDLVAIGTLTARLVAG